MGAPAVLASIGIPVLIKIVKKALGKMDNSIAKGAAEALEAVDEAIAQGGISIDELKEANRHIEAMAETQSQEFQTVIRQVNESLRAEVASTDKYVRRMRPTFGYIMAFTWAAQMLSIAFVILDDPKEAGAVMNGMADLSAIWTVGLSVLGIYVYKRSHEKTLSHKKDS